MLLLFCIACCSAAAAGNLLFVLTVWLLKLEEKMNDEVDMERMGRMRA